ncbi:MAG: ATP synthase F1 subunit epsilon [Oscillospiraceae bacterium]|nr:ATP synthase F1 subunit epsilon [Oscillospiraceae bacterium]
MTPFNLKIITPSKVIFDDKTENVIVRTTVGDVGILAGHEPYVAALPVGRMKMMDKDGKYKLASLSTGTIRVEEGGKAVVILAQSCEWKNQIDIPRAEKSKEIAEKRMADSDLPQMERELAEQKYKRAVNRLEVAKELDI